MDYFKDRAEELRDGVADVLVERLNKRRREQLTEDECLAGGVEIADVIAQMMPADQAMRDDMMKRIMYRPAHFVSVRRAQALEAALEVLTAAESVCRFLARRGLSEHAEAQQLAAAVLKASRR